MCYSAEALNREGDQRITGLDGLRAIAVAAVLLFHADFYWARGGYLGVDLFFVISGFLITGLLANEVEASGRLDLRRFYWRRAKRLLPASWLMIVGVIGAASLIAVDALPRLRGDTLASFFYLTNWELLSVHVSYFESTGRPPLLQHLWSLAIEEQFYILWALFVPWGLLLAGRRGLAVVALLLGAASAAWMAVLAAKIGYPGQGDPSRLYFGTDTHGFPLLIGSTLGLMWQPERTTWLIHPLLRAIYVLCGLFALVAFLALIAFLGEETATLYPWGLLLGAVASLILIAVASHPSLAFGRWLDVKPLRWIGHRSYGIYLWHWPVFMLTRPGIDLRAWNAHEALVLRLVLSVGIAALSYRFVEMPIRHGALERLWRSIRADRRRRKESRANRVRPRSSAWRVAALTSFALIAAGFIANVLWRTPTHVEPKHEVLAALDLETVRGTASVSRKQQPTIAGSLGAEVEPTKIPIKDFEPVKVNVEADQPDLPVVASFTGQDLTAVGDSVLLGSSQLLQITLRGVDVHATMGWQAADILRQLQALNKTKKLRPVVLLHLGTNGYVYEGQLRQILTTLKACKRVVLINTHVPRRWMEANNLLIDRVAPDFPNVVIARWSDISEGQPDYFVTDGVHLTDLGQRAYIADIMRVGHLVPDVAHTPNPAAIDPTKDYATGSGDLSPTLILASQPPAPDAYWQKLARCETDTDWTNTGERSGGLAIMQDDWNNWGGTAFAKSPAEATSAQQIEVANRISTQGWTRPDGILVRPIGFARWRCVAALPPPRLRTGGGQALMYTPESVIAQSFHVGERGNVVRDLQAIVGVPRDGIYSRATRRKHLAYLVTKNLPQSLAGEKIGISGKP